MCKTRSTSSTAYHLLFESKFHLSQDKQCNVEMVNTDEYYMRSVGSQLGL